LRDALFHHLDRYGVASVQAAQAMHRIAFYADHYDWRAQDFPSADAADRTTLCLPIFPSMSDADIGVVIEAVRSFSAD
jgi:dTDP-4-amino-4,6-dideoxygalactose transaminase